MTPIADTFAHMIQWTGYISSVRFDVFPGIVNAGYACSIAQHDVENT